MKPIDFDAHYAEFAEKWVRENMKKYKTVEQMEAQLPNVYLRWLNQPQQFLDGLTPAEHFGRITDIRALVRLLQDHVEQGVDVPDLLLERMVDLGDDAVHPLMEIAGNAENQQEIRVIALNLLQELGSPAPKALCLGLIDARGEHDDVADVAAELLSGLGAAAVPDMLARLDGASDDALETYLDLLSNYPGDSRVYEHTLTQFRRMAEKRALFASYLAKIGDERAIEPLRQALQLSDLNYLDYIEIRSAIERLGGEVAGSERCFDGDPYYESMRNV